jgi:myosin heavy subunit
VRVVTFSVIETASKLLSIDSGGLEKALTIRVMKVRGSSTSIPMKPDQVIKKIIFIT